MKVAVAGAGSWGTALSCLLAEKGFSVCLWGRSPEKIEEIKKAGRNIFYLPQAELPESLELTSNLGVLKEADIIVLCVPSHALRGFLIQAKEFIGREAIIVSGVKGIEIESLKRMSEVIGEVCPENPKCVLSGPSHAEEVCQHLPTSVVAASKDEKVAKIVQEVFSCDYFRVYTNPDVVGVELGGALKNVIAIAAGICDGMELGANAKAALITRGLAEITRLGIKLGADALTFSGLAGLGDLVATCFSNYSRNRGFGEAVGRGKSVKEAEVLIGQTVEGIRTTKAALKLSQDYGVEMPITQQVYRVLYEGESPRVALNTLMQRSLKEEQYGLK